MHQVYSVRSIAVFAIACLLGLASHNNFGGVMADETVQVKDVQELHEAIDDARGHSGDPLNIVLAAGEYKTDRPLKLIAASSVRISAAKGASVVCSNENGAVFVIAYCNDIQISNLTLRLDSENAKRNTFEDLVRLDHSSNVRLNDCTLEFSTPAADGGHFNEKDVVKAFLGAEILEIVSKPDKILSFQVNPRDDRGPKMLGPHQIVKAGPDLTEAQSKILIGVILDEKTYDFTSAKRSFLVPTYGFKFIKGENEVDLLVDAEHRFEVMFIFNGEEKKEDCDHAKAVLQKLTKDIFPAKN